MVARTIGADGLFGRTLSRAGIAAAGASNASNGVMSETASRLSSRPATPPLSIIADDDNALAAPADSWGKIISLLPRKRRSDAP